MPDIFDRIKEKQNKEDIFNRLKEQEESSKKLDELTKSLSETIKKSIKANKYVPPPLPDFDKEIAKRIPPLDIEKLTSDVQKKVLNNIPLPSPQIIVEKHIEKLVEKKTPTVDLEARKLIEELKNKSMVDNESRKLINRLEQEIESLTDKLKELKKDVDRPLFIPAPPIIPNWTDKKNKILSNDGQGLKWIDELTGLSIEDVVVGGTTNTVLYIDNDGKLASNSNFGYSSSAVDITLTNNWATVADVPVDAGLLLTNTTEEHIANRTKLLGFNFNNGSTSLVNFGYLYSGSPFISSGSECGLFGVRLLRAGAMVDALTVNAYTNYVSASGFIFSIGSTLYMAGSLTVTPDPQIAGLILSNNTAYSTGNKSMLLGFNFKNSVAVLTNFGDVYATSPTVTSGSECGGMVLRLMKAGVLTNILDINANTGYFLTGTGMNVGITGNVGIGMVAPTVKLTVQGSNSTSSLTGQLVTNGTFNLGTTGWTLGSGWYWDAPTQSAGHDRADFSFETINQNINVTGGKTYKVTLDVESAADTVVGELTVAEYLSFSIEVAGAVTQYFTATATGAVELSVMMMSDTEDVFIDNISVQEITGTTDSLINVLNSDGTEGIEIRSGGSALENTFVGFRSGYKNYSGYYNVGFGRYALGFNTTGSYNVALGHEAMLYNTSGSENIAIGKGSLVNSSVGNLNVAIGLSSLGVNTTGSQNVGIGAYVLGNNTIGNYNFACGYLALASNINGANNLALGVYSVSGNQSGNNIVGVGASVGFYDITGSNWVGVGSGALLNQSGGNGNTGIGAQALANNVAGTYNTAVGYYAGAGNISYPNNYNNVCIGAYSGYILQAGNNNILVGYKAGEALTTADNCIVIGYDIDAQSVSTSGQLSIGNLIIGTGLSATGTTVSTGKIGIGVAAPASRLHLPAGSATANTAPLQFNSGTLETNARAGVMEFLTDDVFFTITTGTARKAFVLDDGTRLTATRVPFATTNGRLTDDADLTFATDTLTVTKAASTNFKTSSGTTTLYDDFIYGQMYGDDVSITITVSSSGIYYVMGAGLSSGTLNGMTHASSVITVPTAGVYKVDWGATIKCATANQFVSVAIAVKPSGGSDGAIVSTEGSTKLTTANDEQCVAGTGILTLGANAEVKFCAENETAANNIIVTHATLTLIRIDN